MHSVRYAHSEGYTEICYAQDKGQQFITSGEDGEIRIWQGFDDVDNRSIQVRLDFTTTLFRVKHKNILSNRK